MKVALVVFFCVCVHLSSAFDGDIVALMKLTPAEKKQSYQFMRECEAQENATQEDLAQLNEKSKCLLKCFYVKQGFLREDGQLDASPLVNALSKINYKVADVCADPKLITATDLCQKCYDSFNCYLRHYIPEQ